MKKKNGNITDNASKSISKHKPSVSIGNITTDVTDKVKAKAGKGSSNEGTNVSYEEER